MTKTIVFTTNKEITDWTEMLCNPVLATALLYRLLFNARCYSLKGESYRMKYPGRFSNKMKSGDD